MIPKTIHFCWFGRGEYPEKVKYCMESWKVFLPDYQFKLWNEDNFDLDLSPFVRQAYDNGKYAFVSDYVRVYALKNEGGIYLDTDIEVVKPFQDLLEQRLILGTDESGYLTAFMAAEAEHPYFASLLSLYDRMSFLNPDGSLNTEVNNTWMQNMLEPYGYQRENKFQNLDEGIVVYPCEYFHAKSLTSGKLMTTRNTYCIHHHTLLWVTPKTRMIRWFRMKILVPMLGADRYTAFTNHLKGNGHGR
jgi:hypothetical protein